MNYIIVTNTYNRTIKLVERSLRASFKQSPLPLNIILIDQNNSPLILSDDIVSHPLFIHQKVAVRSVSAARNRLCIPEQTDWVLFCDDDGYLDEHYIEKWCLLKNQYPLIQIFAGSIRRDDNGSFYSVRHQVGGSLKKFWNAKLLMGSNLMVSKFAFEKLDRFDERFGAGAYWGSSEETDFAWKAYFEAIPMEYFPELVVYHVRPYAGSWINSVKKAYAYGIGKGALVAKWLTKGRGIVLLELAEMFLVPWVQMVRSLLRGELAQIVIYGGGLIGRFCGLIWYLMKR